MNKLIDRNVINESYIVLEKLNLLDKLPEDVLKFLKANIEEGYSFEIDLKIPLDIQIKNENTKIYLSYLFLKYINDSKEEKEILLNMYKENQAKEDELLREKYNPDNIFVNNKDMEKIEESKEEHPLVIDKKVSILGKIKSFFKNLFFSK